MKTSSAKAKGRELQKTVRDWIVDLHPSFRLEDVKSTAMGQSGSDVQLSPFVSDVLPLSFECKSHKSFAVYKIIEQCKSNTPKGHEPVVVLKQNRSKPVVVVDAEHYFSLWKDKLNDNMG